MSVLNHRGTCILCLQHPITFVQGWEGEAWLTPWGKDHAAKPCWGVHLPMDSLCDFKLWLPYSRPRAKALLCISLVFFGSEILCTENFVWKNEGNFFLNPMENIET